jgi:hypothetical protein
VNATLPFSEFFEVVGGKNGGETSLDFIEPFISFMVSRFTSDYSFLFAAYAAVFAFFWIKSINSLYNSTRENLGWNGLIHLAFFIAIIPITGINGFRMWTAAWVFFFGAYHVVLYRKKAYIFLALSASLVHFSFMFANAILLIYYFAGNKNYVYYPLALISFVLPHIIAPAFRTISFALGGALQSRYEGYSDEQYLQTMQDIYEENDWFLQIGSDIVLYYLLFGLIYIQLKSPAHMQEKSMKNLYSFLLLFLAFVNFGGAIPTLGERFMTIFFLFAAAYLFLYFARQFDRGIELLTWIGLFPMALFSAIIFRQGSVSINAWLFAPGFGLPFFAPAISLAEVIFY